VVNKYDLRRYLISFFILNKDLLLKNKKLTIIRLKVINIKIRQIGKSLSLALRIYL